MSKDSVIDSLGRIDDDMIQSVETLRRKKKRPAWMKWGAMAACFCLLVAAVTVAPGLFPGTVPLPPGSNDFPVQTNNPNQSEGAEHTEGPWSPWQANFNMVTGVMDAARRYIPGYFTEELSKAEIAAVEPGMRYEYMQYSGHGGFDGDGDLVAVYLTVTTSIPENNVSVVLSQSDTVRDYILDAEPVVSICNQVEYRVYQWDCGNSGVTLAADAVINDCTFAFTLETSQQDLEQAKEDFTRVLECFAYDKDGNPDLTAIVADEIPEWFDKTLSHKEALDDPTYGAYMIQVLPNGFAEESVRRYKDQASDYLSGLWTRGYDELQWRVYTISEADKTRLTGVAEREKYDLSLYPIPRASSVPEELREIVDDPIFSAEDLTMDAVWARAYKTGETGDSSGWRMAFSVRYGDIIVEVRTKGVDPQWVYQQLMALIAE